MTTTETELVILVPLLQRPHRIEPLLQSIADGTPESHRVDLLVTHGDQAVHDTALLLAKEWDNVTVRASMPRRTGDYAFKINSAYGWAIEPFMFLAADDLLFHPGWWPAARARFEDPRIGVVGTNDLAHSDRSRRGEHATHCVVRRSYVDQHGLISGERKVLYDGYPHEYVDDELVGTAKKRGAWTYAFDSVVEHLHPSWGKAPMDDLYRKQRQRMALGRNLFNQRRRLWM